MQLCKLSSAWPHKLAPTCERRRCVTAAAARCHAAAPRASGAAWRTAHRLALLPWRSASGVACAGALHRLAILGGRGRGTCCVLPQLFDQQLTIVGLAGSVIERLHLARQATARQQPLVMVSVHHRAPPCALSHVGATKRVPATCSAFARPASQVTTNPARCAAQPPLPAAWQQSDRSGGACSRTAKPAGGPGLFPAVRPFRRRLRLALLASPIRPPPPMIAVRHCRWLQAADTWHRVAAASTQQQRPAHSSGRDERRRGAPAGGAPAEQVRWCCC